MYVLLMVLIFSMLRNLGSDKTCEEMTFISSLNYYFAREPSQYRLLASLSLSAQIQAGVNGEIKYLETRMEIQLALCIAADTCFKDVSDSFILKPCQLCLTRIRSVLLT